MFTFFKKECESVDRKATEILHRAIEADKSGSYERAIELYATGIEMMLVQHKRTKDAEILKHINNYMNRAEELKEVVQCRKSTSNAQVSAPHQSMTFSKKNSQYALTILDEVLDRSPAVQWDDIAGLSIAKQMLKEAVILPMLRPDLFTGLRAPPKGVLLFGPPGTGKTLLAKAIASESKATFFNISAASLTSKWVGDGEKLVRALFEMANELQPAVIFLDEIDALLSKRSSSETDASRRIKNQFFTELDGVGSTTNRILVMGATNLPMDLDDAIIRRLEKRIYIPLPDAASRKALIQRLMLKSNQTQVNLSTSDLNQIVASSKGYSGSDLVAVCKDAAMGPIRDITNREVSSGSSVSLLHLRNTDVRPIELRDFQVALTRVRASVNNNTIKELETWNKDFGVSAS